MNTILLAASMGTLVALAVLRWWPYMAVLIMLAGETASLAIAIVTADHFWIAVDGSLVGLLLALLFYLGGRDMRRPAPQLIGDKSAVRRAVLVRTQRKAQSPSL